MPDDQPRPAATSRDDYTLKIEDVAARYETAGHPRTIRTLQRYCAKGHLDCLRQETPFGEQFVVTPASVARHIAQIAEFAATVGRDTPRPAATAVAAPSQDEASDKHTATGTDQPRPAAPAYVDHIERENEFLRGEIGVKNRTIEALLERDRETNILVGQLQKMLAPLLGRPTEREANSIPAAPADPPSDQVQ